MSTLDSKLETTRTAEGRAQRTLASLRMCRGYVGQGATPPVVSICPADRRTTWEHVSGRGDGALYEMTGEEVVRPYRPWEDDT